MTEGEAGPPLGERTIDVYSPNWRGPLRKRRRGPVRRLALFASGVDLKRLEFVPEDETSYSVIGSSVLLTSALGVFSGTVATGVILDGAPEAKASHIAGGLMVGALIFVLDRILVREPLNPFTFPREVLQSLWNPRADSEWFEVLANNLHAPSALGRIRQFLTSVAKVLLRLIVAFTLSYFIAEMVALIVFEPEVTDRVESLRIEQAQDVEDAIVAQYAPQLQRLETERSGLAVGTGSSDGLRDLVAQTSTDLALCNSELEDLNAQYQAEVNGEVLGNVTGGGVGEETTGLAGRGPAAINLEGRIAEQETTCGSLQTDLGLYQADYERAIEMETTASEDAAADIDVVDDEIDRVETERDGAIADARSEIFGTTAGLALRRTALESLAQDSDPVTAALDETNPCTGPGAFCAIKGWAWPGTPMGNIIGLVRVFFLTVDLMPVLLKLQHSLRRRRPYDSLSAALEERSFARSIDALDEELVGLGHDLEARASWRKAQRSGTGAMYVLERDSAARRRLRDRLVSRRQVGKDELLGTSDLVPQSLGRNAFWENPNTNGSKPPGEATVGRDPVAAKPYDHQEESGTRNDVSGQ